MDFKFKRNSTLIKLSILDSHAELTIESGVIYTIYLDLKFINNANRSKLKHIYMKGRRIHIKHGGKIEELKYTVVKHFSGYLHDEIVSIKFKDGDLFNCRYSNLEIKLKEPVTSVILEDTEHLKPVKTINKDIGWSKKIFYKDDYAILEFTKLTKEGLVKIQSLFDKHIIENLELNSISLDYRKSQIDRNRWRVKYLKQKIHRYILEAPKNLEVDHLDRNPLNNRLCNLRLCDHRTNILNQDVSIRSNTGLKGIQIYYHSKTKKKYIRISISLMGKTSYKFIDPLKYKNEEEAMEYAQFIRKKLEKENKYSDICSHEGSETIESTHRSNRD